MNGSHPEVLLVEDDDASRELMREMIELRGYTVDVASDAFEARDKLESHLFDAVVTDLIMPGDGQSVIRWIRAHRPSVPVIAMTAQEAREVRHQALASGAFVVLQKPIYMADLLPQLRKAVAGTKRQDG